MKYITYFFQILLSDIFLILRFFCGNRIGFNLISLVSPLSTIKTRKGKIKMGKLTAIRANTEIYANGGDINLGKKCFVNKNCMIVAHEKIAIGNGTTIGPNVCIYDHDHNYKKDGQSDFISKPITIGKNVWIGAGAIILKGVCIADNVVIAAGSIVTKSVKTPNVIFYQRKNDFLVARRNIL